MGEFVLKHVPDSKVARYLSDANHSLIRRAMGVQKLDAFCVTIQPSSHQPSSQLATKRGRDDFGGDGHNVKKARVMSQCTLNSFFKKHV